MSQRDALPRILFVDDEADLLAGLRQTLRKERKRWKIDYALGALEALDKLVIEPATVVVSDMRMPIMEGATFLTKVKELYPGTIRFVLSGEASEKLSIRAVQCAHQWLSKPCSREVLVGTIERALSLMGRIEDPKMREWVASTGGLPSAPDTFLGLQAELQEPEADLEKITAWIERDPGLTARILQMTNSSFFAKRKEVERVRDAIITIGLRLLSQLVVATELFHTVGTHAKGAKEIFEHSQAVAQIASAIAKELELDPHVALTAGLLHDVGRLVLAQHGVETSEDCVEVDGYLHGDIGGALLQGWGLPHDIVEAAVFHHKPSEMETVERPLVGIVHIANALASGSPLDEAYMEQVGWGNKIDAWRTQFTGGSGLEDAA